MCTAILQEPSAKRAKHSAIKKLAWVPEGHNIVETLSTNFHGQNLPSPTPFSVDFHVVHSVEPCMPHVILLALLVLKGSSSPTQKDAF
eukprot:4658431-Amphidinium_carterae.1